MHPRTTPTQVASLDLPPHTWLHRGADGGWLLIRWDLGWLGYLDADLGGPVHELTLADWPPGRLGTWVLAAAADRSSVAVVSHTGIGVYDAAGKPLWRRPLRIEPTRLPGIPACHLDDTGRLWTYLPGLLVVHDVHTGDEIARAALDDSGGGSFLHHPDVPDILGLQGTTSWWIGLDGTDVVLRRAAGEYLTDTLPGGRYLAVPQDDLADGVTVRRWGDGTVLARRPLSDLTGHVGGEDTLIESGATVGTGHVLLGVADPEDPDEAEHHVLLDAGTLETVGWLDYGSPLRVYSLVGAQGARWLTQEGPDEPARLWELPA